MATSATELETAYRAAAARVRDKAAELATAEAAHAETVAALVDGKGDRAKVLAQRAALAVDMDALRAELSELSRRRDVADLVRFESDLETAKVALAVVAARATDQRHALDAALEARGSSFNAPARSGESPESARALAEIEATIARAKAESAIAGRDLERARLVRDDAQLALDAARERLGIGGAEQQQASSRIVKG